MLDPTARRQQLLALAQQSEVAVVVCDVILGWGVHADPAGALAAAWQETAARVRADGRHLVGVATVCGTPADVQGYDQQCEVLRAAGFILADSNAQAVRLAAAMVDGQTPPGRGHGVSAPPGAWIDAPTQGETLRHLAALFATGPRVINLGLQPFADQIAACGVPVVHVDWRPPAGGNTRLSNLLERLR